MKHASVFSLLIACLLASADIVTASENLAGNQATTEAIRQETSRQNELLRQINQDVADGIKHVANAVELLDRNQDKEAIEALQAATGKFDIALAANPDLALIPVDAHVTVFDLAASADVIRNKIKAVKSLIDDGKIQQARIQLAGLRDELLINTVYLPMATYPDSVKLATRYLVDNKRNEAIAVLSVALTSTVSETAVIPLGLIRAQSLIQQASELADEKEAAMDFIQAAAQQLEIARLLGYTDDESALYQSLEQQIANLKQEINGKNAVTRLYQKLAESFSELISREGRPLENRQEKQLSDSKNQGNSN